LKSEISTRFGVGYRRPLAEQFFDMSDELDVLEVLVEQFFPLTDDRIRELVRLREAFDLIPHGVSMSLGSSDPRTMPMFNDLKRLLEVIEPPYFSEHVAVSRAGGFDIWHLSPVWRTDAGLDTISRNVEIASAELALPIVLETITEMVRLPGATYSWGEFLTELHRRTQIAFLIDVTNVWLNAKNGVAGDLDCLFEEIAGLPWIQFHVAGYSMANDGFLIDSHDAPIQEEIFSVYQNALSVQRPGVVILERDAEFETLADLVVEVGRLRSISDSLSS
jgi:uncharacterized protein (UPF0276 family)